MSINEMFAGGAQVVCVSADDLKAFAQQIATETAAAIKPQTPDNFLSIDATAKHLHVSRRTLQRWDKTGYLPGHKIGGRVCYYLSDVERIGGKAEQ